MTKRKNKYYDKEAIILKRFDKEKVTNLNNQEKAAPSRFF